MSTDEILPDELRHPEIVFIPKVMLTYPEAAQCTGLSFGGHPGKSGQSGEITRSENWKVRPVSNRGSPRFCPTASNPKKSMKKNRRGAKLGQNALLGHKKGGYAFYHINVTAFITTS